MALLKAVLCVALVAMVLATVAPTYEEMFAKFKATYNKKYASTVEDQERFSVFVANMKTAEELNRKNPLAHFGANEFSDLTPAEFKSRHNADSYYQRQLTRPKSGKPATITDTMIRANVTAIDWRTKGAVTPVKNQGQCGSCWAFSTTGGIEGQWFLAGNPLTSLSEQELVSCDTLDSGCGGGLMDNAMTWLVNDRNGQIVTEASYPYVSGGGVAPACNLNGKVVGATITGHYNLPHVEEQMRQWCSTNGPISIAVDATSWQTYSGGIMTNCISQSIDHGVLIVGFDMNNSPPYWIIKNSWGASWGEQGYIRVEYGTDQCLLTSYPCSSIVNGGPTPPPTGPPTPPTAPPEASKFLIYGNGANFPTPPAGYRLATLKDVQSDEFVHFYNSNQGVPDGGESMVGLNACCAFKTENGYLVVKGNPVTYLGPYSASGDDCADQLISPVTFGTQGGGQIPWGTNYLELNSTTVKSFETKPNFDPLYQRGCTAGANTWGVFVRGAAPPPPSPPPGPTAPPSSSKYLIYGSGSGFPTPPAGYRLASLKEIQTSDFVTHYNSNNGIPDGGESMTGLNACCVMNTADGYLVVSGNPVSYLGPYDSTGDDCSDTLVSPVTLGVEPGGGLPEGTNYLQLNLTVVKTFTTSNNFSPLYSYGCTAGANTWGVFIQGSGPSPSPPPTPAPSESKYLIYGSGTAFPTPPAGYRLAKLSEIQTQEFVTDYNSASGIPDGGESMTGLNACCCFNTADGYLVVNDSPVSYVGPYSANGDDCSDTLISPVTLGLEPGGGGQFPTNYLTLSLAIVKTFTTAPNFNPLFATGCSAGANTWGVFIRSGKNPTPQPNGPSVPPIIDTPPFVLYGYGPDWPTPPAGYELADLNTLKSDFFLDYYNTVGLTDLGESVSGCCVFKTYDGYLTIGNPPSFFGPYTAAGYYQCDSTLTNPVWFGTDRVSGEYPGQYIGPLNKTTVKRLTAAANFSSDDCGAAVDSWGIYMLTGANPGPTAQKMSNVAQRVSDLGSNPKSTKATKAVKKVAGANPHKAQVVSANPTKTGKSRRHSRQSKP